MKYSSRKKLFHRRQKIALIVFIVLIISLVAVAGLVRKAYTENLKPLNSSSDTAIIVTIDPGSTTGEIADILENKKVIRSAQAFEWYVRSNNLRDDLKAGTYLLKPSQSVQEIVDKIIEADVATDLVTILPGKRLDQIREGLIKAGFSGEDVDKALEPSRYKSHPALTDLPKGANLEGYIYPESFQKISETTPSEIIEKSLDEMNRYLTPEVREGFSKQGLNVHQAITIASIVEQEVGNESDRPVVAQVFLKRYKEGIQLGADPTAFYGAIINDKEPTVVYDSPYNTRLHEGLPPGPIGNVSMSSIEAVAFPAQTDWLYFVAGDDGVTHFSKTLEEHEALTRKHCTKLCNQSN
ncbi:MAG: endolytic transglycosylase MltG [Candidatus Saccharimonadales bacterium]